MPRMMNANQGAMLAYGGYAAAGGASRPAPHQALMNFCCGAPTTAADEKARRRSSAAGGLRKNSTLGAGGRKASTADGGEGRKMSTATGRKMSSATPTRQALAARKASTSDGGAGGAAAGGPRKMSAAAKAAIRRKSQGAGEEDASTACSTARSSQFGQVEEVELKLVRADGKSKLQKVNGDLTLAQLFREYAPAEFAGITESEMEILEATKKKPLPLSSTVAQQASMKMGKHLELLFSKKDPPGGGLRRLIDASQLTINSFALGPTVGTGSFGRVRVAKFKSGPVSKEKPFALKIMKKSEVIKTKQVEHIRNEKLVLETLEHPFVVNFVCSFQDPKRLFIVLEYVNGGELFGRLREKGKLPDTEAAFYTAEICMAFEYLHSMHIAYRDLKPENLLLNSKGHIKITDFGFAKKVDKRTFTLCGTPEYLAPEIIQSKGHNEGVDWWALGVLLYEIIAGYPPYEDDNPMMIYQKVLEGKIEFPSHFSKKAKELILGFLTKEPKKRLGCTRNGAADVKKHTFYSDIDWPLLLQMKET